MPKITALLIFAVMLVVPEVLHSQIIRDQKSKLGSLEDDQTSFPQYMADVSEQILEKPVDPESYMVGPGDVITVNIWGGLEQSLPLKVNPEGTLSIPTVGDLKVGGISLAKVKEIIIDRVKRVYSPGDVTVHLTKLRRFRIPVSGIIPYPGVYDASAADRVSHLLDKAGRLVIKDEMTKTRKRPHEEIKPLSSWRNIYLIHRGGDTTRVDFLMFARSLDTEYNPFVKEGDAIFVPPLSEEIGTVELNGSVKIPGVIESSKGDKLREVIELSGGLTDEAKLDSIIVSRCKGNTSEFDNYYLNLAENPQAWDFPILPDDRIMIKSVYDYHLRQQVTITGEVIYPGVYSIVEKRTRLSEVVGMAGGFTGEANLSDAEIIRTAEEEISDPEFERLKQISVADMSEMEYEYFKTKSREKAIVVADFEAIFLRGESDKDIQMRDNDEINIPVQAKTIRVSGQVLSPGLINWEPGKDFQYYIEKSGGYSYNARKSKIRIIRAATGTWLKPDKKTIINVGDTIFVPEKTERDYWVIYKDILLVFTQMITITVLINTVSK